MTSNGVIITDLIWNQNLSRRQVRLLGNKNYITKFESGGEIDSDYLSVLISRFPEKLSDECIKKIYNINEINMLYKNKALATKLTDEQVNRMIMNSRGIDMIVTRKDIGRLTDKTLEYLIKELVIEYYTNTLINLYQQISKEYRGYMLSIAKRHWNNEAYNSFADRAETNTPYY